MDLQIQFLLHGEGISHDNKIINDVHLSDAIDSVLVRDGAMPFDLVVSTLVAVVENEELSGKTLDVIGFKLDRDGKRETIPGWAETHWELPDYPGGVISPPPLVFPISTPGFYGCDVVDLEGALFMGVRLTDEPRRLATYSFSVFEESQQRP